MTAQLECSTKDQKPISLSPLSSSDTNSLTRSNGIVSPKQMQPSPSLCQLYEHKINQRIAIHLMSLGTS